MAAHQVHKRGAAAVRHRPQQRRGNRNGRGPAAHADAGHKKGTIDATENDIIKNVFAFDDLTVGEICTHRKEVAVLWMDETIAQWEQTIHESRHSVYRCAATVWIRS